MPSFHRCFLREGKIIGEGNFISSSSSSSSSFPPPSIIEILNRIVSPRNARAFHDNLRAQRRPHVYKSFIVVPWEIWV